MRDLVSVYTQSLQCDDGRYNFRGPTELWMAASKDKPGVKRLLDVKAEWIRYRDGGQVAYWNGADHDGKAPHGR